MNRLIERIYATYNTGLTPNDTGSVTKVSDIVEKAVNILGTIAGALALIYLLWSGIMYITANGNTEAAKKAQTGIINAVIGIVIILAAYAIFSAVTNTSNGLLGS